MKMNDLSATCCDSKLGRASNMLPAVILAAILSLSMAASGLPLFSSLFVFGDSLADTGNSAIVLGTLYGPGAARSSTPIPAADFIPDYPYTSNRYSNGPVWTEQFASSLGLSAQPSLMGGTDFAFGGARMGPLFSSFPYSVSDQLASFLSALSANGDVAPASALYVVQGGGNDVRDIVAGGGDPSALVSAYVASTIGILSELKSAGAYNILFANIPDIGKAPAIQALGPDAVFGASMLVTERPGL